MSSARRLRVRRERGRGGREGSVGGEWECVADARRLRGRMGMCLGCSKWLITIVPGGLLVERVENGHGGGSRVMVRNGRG